MVDAMDIAEHINTHVQKNAFMYVSWCPKRKQAIAPGDGMIGGLQFSINTPTVKGKVTIERDKAHANTVRVFDRRGKLVGGPRQCFDPALCKVVDDLIRRPLYRGPSEF